MHQLVHVPQGTLHAFDKNGKKVNISKIYAYIPEECEDLNPCDKEVIRVLDPDAPNEWYEIDLVELAKSLAAPVVTKVVK